MTRTNDWKRDSIIAASISFCSVPGGYDFRDMLAHPSVSGGYDRRDMLPRPSSLSKPTPPPAPAPSPELPKAKKRTRHGIYSVSVYCKATHDATVDVTLFINNRPLMKIINGVAVKAKGLVTSGPVLYRIEEETEFAIVESWDTQRYAPCALSAELTP